LRKLPALFYSKRNHFFNQFLLTVYTFLTYVTPVVCVMMSEKYIVRKELFMGVRNRKRETLKRLDSKTLDARFLNEIRNGLNCSPFEAEAVLEVVKEVYFPFLDEQSVKAPPGKVTLIAVSADEPAGKPVADCEKTSVSLTIHRGSEDDRILQERGRLTIPYDGFVNGLQVIRFLSFLPSKLRGLWLLPWKD
jgi:hypothetical protein